MRYVDELGTSEVSRVKRDGMHDVVTHRATVVVVGDVVRRGAMYGFTGTVLSVYKHEHTGKWMCEVECLQANDPSYSWDSFGVTAPILNWTVDSVTIVRHCTHGVELPRAEESGKWRTIERWTSGRLVSTQCSMWTDHATALARYETLLSQSQCVAALQQS